VHSTIDLSDASDAIKAGAVKGLTLAVEGLLTEANKHVPHDEGTLERSGEASVDEAELKGAVSYNTPYAVRQHEDMDLTHPGKGEPKWLETTITQNATKVGETIATAIKQELGT
jgi:hypothetical protein